jgi:hypothetical protein
MKVKILQTFEHYPVEDGPIECVHAGSRPDVDPDTAGQWKQKGLAVDDESPAVEAIVSPQHDVAG